MAFDWVAWVLEHTGAARLVEATRIQSLWGGYGELLRLSLEGGPIPSAVLKQVVPPDLAAASFSDRRKRLSYAIEQAWYRGLARHCDETCRIAVCYASASLEDRSFLLLEDLHRAGYYPGRPPRIRAGLTWLAHFHARFLGARPDELWEQGSYWHLDTRPEEWRRMPAGPLKTHAADLDRRLQAARFQTLLHGDAKPSNFCWNEHEQAAAVDFQYVGPGCGIRDIAYFLDGCLGESGCAQHAQDHLDFYFARLHQALGQPHPELETEWRTLFPVAWADLCRFEQGWGAPGPLGPYSQRQLQLALAQL